MENKPQVFLMVQDRVLGSMYETRLTSPEYCTVWCENAVGWENSLGSFAYDVIVVDLGLFPETPIESLRQLRRISPESDVIVLSPSEDARVAIAAFKTGIVEYFLKPISPEQLAWAVEKFLRRKQFHSTDMILSADFDVFRAAHHISISENETKMRELAMRSLIGILKAQGGVWVWPDVSNDSASSGKNLEFHNTTEDSGTNSWKEFEAKHTPIGATFETHLTSHPEHWFHGNTVWIPLKHMWMGGIYLFGTSDTPVSSTQARVEFLIRNLEISLENVRRYLEAKQLSYVDDFTGLYNSRYLDVALTSAIDQATTHRQGFAVLFIDVDHFKSVNDRFGHLVGSGLLTSLAQTLKRLVRKQDQLFRYGGDEFVILLNDLENSRAKEVGERIRSHIETHPFHIHGNEIKITLSIGVSRYPEHSKSKKHIVELADKAMYSVKKKGRNAVYEVIP